MKDIYETKLILHLTP